MTMHDLHVSEAGETGGLNSLLIFAMVALPLLGLLIVFGKGVVEFANTQYSNYFADGGNAVTTGH